jgi:hypothetical protein
MSRFTPPVAVIEEQEEEEEDQVNESDFPLPSASLNHQTQHGSFGASAAPVTDNQAWFRKGT